jgi:hypothetical protein
MACQAVHTWDDAVSSMLAQTHPALLAAAEQVSNGTNSAGKSTHQPRAYV